MADAQQIIKNKIPTERDLLMRRIRMQRRELRSLNKTIKLYAFMLKAVKAANNDARRGAYRHAAAIAEGHMFGKRIAGKIRKWQ